MSVNSATGRRPRTVAATTGVIRGVIRGVSRVAIRAVPAVTARPAAPVARAPAPPAGRRADRHPMPRERCLHDTYHAHLLT